MVEMPFRVLILGGTTEANRLAAAVVGDAKLAPLLSLAGRTREPALPPIPYRIGGFGGVEGLAAFLQRERMEAVVDATHPFATRISANAAAACARLGRPHVVLTRPPWSPREGDRWTVVPDLAAAADALGATSQRVLLTTGRLGLAAFKAAPRHDYLLRTIDPPEAGDCPPRCRIVQARGPFGVEAEVVLLQAEAIEVVVSKNSGGPGAGKIEAARRLGLPVVMVERPPALEAPTFTTVEAVLAWIVAHRGTP